MVQFTWKAQNKLAESWPAAQSRCAKLSLKYIQRYIRLKTQNQSSVCGNLSDPQAKDRKEGLSALYPIPLRHQLVLWSVLFSTHHTQPLLLLHLCNDKEKLNTIGINKHCCPGCTKCTNDDLGAVGLFMCQSDFPSVAALSTHTYCAPGALQGP